MFNKLLKIRNLFIVAVIFILLNSMYFLTQGVLHSIHGYRDAFSHGFTADSTVRPGMSMLEALDSFMVAFVFLIFGLGIAKLFIFNEASDSDLPSWLNIHDFKELKILLWETILVALVIYALGDFVKNPPSSWESLLQPLFILILTIALFFMRDKSH